MSFAPEHLSSLLAIPWALLELCRLESCMRLVRPAPSADPRGFMPMCGWRLGIREGR